jgi:hypothetical protein
MVCLCPNISPALLEPCFACKTLRYAWRPATYQRVAFIHRTQAQRAVTEQEPGPVGAAAGATVLLAV